MAVSSLRPSLKKLWQDVTSAVRGGRAKKGAPRLWVEWLEGRLQPSASAAPALVDPGAHALQQIDHFVVIYQENWSFDGLYSKFPGANGAPPGTNANQVDKNGNALPTLPTPSTDPSVPGAAGLPTKT